jgi:hypothetical protein
MAEWATESVYAILYEDHFTCVHTLCVTTARNLYKTKAYNMYNIKYALRLRYKNQSPNLFW